MKMVDITYEVGTNEPPHPDFEVCNRLIVVGVSRCKYGCPIYKDPQSSVYILVHTDYLGCTKRKIQWPSFRGFNFN